MNDPVLNLNRTEVTIDGTDPPLKYRSVRFLYYNGTAAVWQDDRATRSSHRVLYATGAELIKPLSAREPIQLIAAETTWLIKQTSGGCGCGSPLKKIPFSQLLAPDFTDT